MQRLSPLLRRFSTNARVEEVRAATATRLAGRVKFYKEVSVRELDVYNAETVNTPIPAGVDLSDAGLRAKQVEHDSERARILAPGKLGKFYTVTLDNRSIKTPAKNHLALPTRAMAHLIAHEWDYQDSHISPSSMPLMSLASTALDQTSSDLEYVRENCMKYLFNDTLCYLADRQEERVLRRWQEEKWRGILELVESDALLGVKPAVCDGELVLGALKHDPVLVERARALVDGYDVWRLTALQSITMEAKSLLLGLALLEDLVTVEQAVAGSRVEEEFQVEQWGCVEGGHDMDRLNNGVQIRAAAVFLDSLKME
jgi:ATP synthase F1 complex assembly factor 2